MKKLYYKKFMLFFLLIMVAAVFITHNFFANKEVEEIEKVKEETKISRKQFAMYVENDDGEYIEYTDSNYFPTDYTLNLEKSYCVDNNDRIVDNIISYENNKVTVKSNKTVYCTLYFDSHVEDKPIFIKVSTDGEENTVPTSGIYKQTTSCNVGNITYNPLYQRLEIGAFNNGTECTLDYTKDTTSYTKLSSIVQSANSTNNNGYRYSGENPNNYIWFNNELWRIIGLIPTCTSASNGTCSSRTNLVKIIRANSIGGLAYDAKESGYTGLWGSNTLYTLLNTYYYGKKDGTGTAYCYGYQATSRTDCDYTTIGISSDSSDYYNQMIESVYWNIGASDHNTTPGTVYGTESAKVTTSTSKIGLMSASDYGYAAVVSGYSTDIFNYATAAITGTNWLYGQGYELTNIQYSSNTTDALSVAYNGFVYNNRARNGYAVRPVVYLDAGVYKISGSGSMLDPYIIGM